MIAEPLPANMGLVPPEPGFLEAVRAQCDRAGALLVLDEVITGFRVARGGAQELLGVRGDLIVLGKVLGGGLPLAAVAGSRDLMERLAPAGETYQAGTLSGNPLATAAGLATLRPPRRCRLRAPRAHHRTPRRRPGGKRRGPPASRSRSRPSRGLLTLFFAPAPVRDYAEARAADGAAFARFHAAMLERGIYLPPSPFEAWFPSLAHGDDEIEATLEAAAEAFEVLAE